MSNKNDKSTDDFEKILKQIRGVTDYFQESVDESAKKSVSNKPMTLEEALKSENPLANIDANIGNSTVEQKLFNLLFDTLLEINSGGVSSIFSKNTGERIGKIRKGLASIGAEQALEAISEGAAYINEHLGESYTDDQFRELSDSEEYENMMNHLAMKTNQMIVEIEDNLLGWVKENLQHLHETK